MLTHLCTPTELPANTRLHTPAQELTPKPACTHTHRNSHTCAPCAHTHTAVQALTQHTHLSRNSHTLPVRAHTHTHTRAATHTALSCLGGCCPCPSVGMVHGPSHSGPPQAGSQNRMTRHTQGGGCGGLEAHLDAPSPGGAWPWQAPRVHVPCSDPEGRGSPHFNTTDGGAEKCSPGLTVLA